MSDQENHDGGSSFEDGLRHILTYGTVIPGGSAQAPPRAAGPKGDPARRIQETADKYQAEQRLAARLGFLRPLAAIAVLVLLAMFVFRIINYNT
jgi:hypothetical protein